MHSIEQLLSLNQIGLIPGPGETLEEFARRADYCLTLKQHLSQEIKASFDGEENEDPKILEPSNRRLSAYYDIAPDWIPIFFSDYRLPFWQGGCAWIFQMAADSPTAALIQLRQAFRQSSRYLGIYQRDELLTHELVHAGRMKFQEPRYEEILAYQTADSSFRRWFGGIVQSSMESVIFVLILGLIVVCDIFLAALNHIDAYMMALWLKLIPFGLILYGVLRLQKRHRCLQACLKNLDECLHSTEKARAVAFRLTDEEIESFSRMTSGEINNYAAIRASEELRWQVICAAYLS